MQMHLLQIFLIIFGSSLVANPARQRAALADVIFDRCFRLESILVSGMQPDFDVIADELLTDQQIKLGRLMAEFVDPPRMIPGERYVGQRVSETLDPLLRAISKIVEERGGKVVLTDKVATMQFHNGRAVLYIPPETAFVSVLHEFDHFLFLHWLSYEIEARKLSENPLELASSIMVTPLGVLYTEGSAAKLNIFHMQYEFYSQAHAFMESNYRFYEAYRHGYNWAEALALDGLQNSSRQTEFLNAAKYLRTQIDEIVEKMVTLANPQRRVFAEKYKKIGHDINVKEFEREVMRFRKAGVVETLNTLIQSGSKLKRAAAQHVYFANPYDPPAFVYLFFNPNYIDDALDGDDRDFIKDLNEDIAEALKKSGLL